MRLSREFSRFFLIPLVLFFGVLATGIFAAYFTSTVRAPSGETLSTGWPRSFTIAFADRIRDMGGTPGLTAEGEELIDENGLWVQILSPDGGVEYAYATPEDMPSAYAPYELLMLYQYGTEDGSVFVGSVQLGEKEYPYLIGFPLHISKVTTYVDNARYKSGKALIVATMALTALLLAGLTVFYNRMVTAGLARIQTALTLIAARRYHADKPPRFLREIFVGLDQLNLELAAADETRARDESAREEWLNNITHDLKTPLVPIRGYAELLSEPDATLTEEQIRRYGGIILKNTGYAEQLVGDLLFTYRLKSGMLPLKRIEVDLSRLVKETVIDLVNTPAYGDRDLTFHADAQALILIIDPLLIRRALTNLLVNALIHSGSDTSVAVSLYQDGGNVLVSVRDNGGGIPKETLDKLFTRYYRGESAGERNEGSGLGMAIAKQIVEAHGGEIYAESAEGRGTAVTFSLPIKN